VVLAVAALGVALYLLRKPVIELGKIFLASFGGDEAAAELTAFQRDVFAVGQALGQVAGFLKDNWGTISTVVTTAFDIMVTITKARL
jgi:hypothetical protein